MSYIHSNFPIVKRAEVEGRKNYQEYRQELRYDFYYSCAYCSITEVEAQGIRFEIDHYMPKSVFPEMADYYDNLMYSCALCNGRKRNYYPNEIDKKKGRYLIRIDEENPKIHFISKGDRIEGITPTGVFNEKILDLNRLSLRRLRSIRRKMWESQEFLISGMRELLSIRLDQIPKEIRTSFLSAKEEILSKYDKQILSMEDFVRESSKSLLLDEDNEAKERIKERRQYLKEIHAVGNKTVPLSKDLLVPKKKRKRKNKRRK